MSKLIKGLHHVNLKTLPDDFDKTVEFYTDVLKLKIELEWDSNGNKGVMLKIGDALLEIMVDSNAKYNDGMFQHIALFTDDVDKVVSAVREAGYKIIEEPKDVDIPSDPPYYVRIAFCRGPVGELIEFFKENRPERIF